MAGVVYINLDSRLHILIDVNLEKINHRHLFTAKINIKANKHYEAQLVMLYHS